MGDNRRDHGRFLRSTHAQLLQWCQPVGSLFVFLFHVALNTRRALGREQIWQLTHACVLMMKIDKQLHCGMRLRVGSKWSVIIVIQIMIKQPKESSHCYFHTKLSPCQPLSKIVPIRSGWLPMWQKNSHMPPVRTIWITSEIATTNRWLSARLQYLRCVSNIKPSQLPFFAFWH